MTGTDSDLDWKEVDTSRELVGVLALPLSIAESLYGGSAEVRHYKEPALQRDIVGKRLVIHDDRPLAEALREPRLQHQLRHDHLVPVITVTDVLDFDRNPPQRIPGEVEILTPFYPDGSVFDAVVRRRERLSVTQCLEIGRAAALGLAELHRQGFVHRDFKSPNLFLTRDGHVARVGDLGEAAPLDADGVAVGLDSPTPWIAPEQVAEDRSSVLSDLFGLGITVVEMLLSGFDLSTYDRSAAHSRMSRGLTPLKRREMEPPPWAPPRVRTLIRQLTEADPGKRNPKTAMDVADVLASTPAVGWIQTNSTDVKKRWEGKARWHRHYYAIDARYLPRKGEWEIRLERRHRAGWRAFSIFRTPSLTRSILQESFDDVVAAS